MYRMFFFPSASLSPTTSGYVESLSVTCRLYAAMLYIILFTTSVPSLKHLYLSIYLYIYLSICIYLSINISWVWMCCYCDWMTLTLILLFRPTLYVCCTLPLGEGLCVCVCVCPLLTVFPSLNVLLPYSATLTITRHLYYIPKTPPRKFIRDSILSYPILILSNSRHLRMHSIH